MSNLISNEDTDECLTPRYGVLPIVKYLRMKGFSKIWCPFDKIDSLFVRVLTNNDFIVTPSHIEDGNDFFKYEPLLEYDCIVSNPPFSKKTEVLKRLYDLDKPFAIILPVTGLQSISRVELFIDNGIEVLCFDRRLNYYTWGNLNSFPENNRFASAYFCKDVLPEKLIFEKLRMIQEPYYDLEDML